MNDDDHMQPLFNALPPAVVALALALVAVELILGAAGAGLCRRASGGGMAA